MATSTPSDEAPDVTIDFAELLNEAPELAVDLAEVPLRSSALALASSQVPMEPSALANEASKVAKIAAVLEVITTARFSIGQDGTQVPGRLASIALALGDDALALGDAAPAPRDAAAWHAYVPRAQGNRAGKARQSPRKIRHSRGEYGTPGGSQFPSWCHLTGYTSRTGPLP